MISHTLETIYVHIPRTAGQSIERAYLDKHGLDWNTRQTLLLRKKKDDEKGPPYLAHLTAKQYTDFDYIDEDKYNDYYKFTTVRNPYDRMISFMRWYDYHDLQHFLFDKFEQVWADEFYFVQPQMNYIYYEQELLVDDVFKFENLDSRIKADEVMLDLHKTNQSERKEDYHDYYTPTCKGIVDRYYGRDVNTFNYEF